REIKRAGATSLRAIADALNARGVPTARGGRWQAQTVSNALARAPETTATSVPAAERPGRERAGRRTRSWGYAVDAVGADGGGGVRCRPSAISRKLLRVCLLARRCGLLR